MENPQPQNETPATNNAAKKKGNSALIIGGLVALLVVAAIVVLVLVVNQSQASQQQAATDFPRLRGNTQGLNGQFGGAGDPNDAQGGGQFGGPGGGRNLQLTPAPELPTAQADLNGVVKQVNGQSLMVGQGFNRGFRPVATPDAAQAAATPLPDVEVIVASDTLIYQDTTPRPDFQNGQPPSGPATLQQQVTLSSLSALPANSRVTVWGDRSGNQLRAKVIVFAQLAIRQP